MEAIPHYIKAILIRESTLGFDDIDTAIVYHNLGVAYYETKEYREALLYYLEALRVFFEQAGNGSRYTLRTYASLGNLFEAQGDHTSSSYY